MTRVSARLVALGAFAAATLGGWRLYRSSHAAKQLGSPTVNAALIARPQVSWPTGTCRRYALAWRSSSASPGTMPAAHQQRPTPEP